MIPLKFLKISQMTNPTEDQLKLREYVLKVLLQEFGSTHSNKLIYECADDWCSKQVTANGIVSYFKAYYNK